VLARKVMERFFWAAMVLSVSLFVPVEAKGAE
jgi:hypothetical protein